MAVQTKSGVFIRENQPLGLLTYNPFSGLFYACAHKDKDQLLMWLNKETSTPPSSSYEKTLGVGWAIQDKDAEYPVPHLLPDANEWVVVPHSYMPMLINWLITGNCLLNCGYCYAQDVMHGKCQEPDMGNIEDIANNILRLDPLVVVLTGGDPLVSPYLEGAIKLLHKKVGIIVDTSGYSLKPEHIEIFRKYGIFVRISLDSEIPRINRYLRPVLSVSKKIDGERSESTDAAVNAIIACINNDIEVGVQSVATTKNRSDFEMLGSKLFHLGISGWRIFMVAPSKERISIYTQLSGDRISQKRFYSHIVRQLMRKQKNIWHDRMSVQVVSNEVPNAIILVAPDGTFLTETNVGKPEIGKVVIDPESPKQPNLDFIHQRIDMHAHTARYLNLEMHLSVFGGDHER